jgi:phytoene dehydrogenase-like protein
MNAALPELPKFSAAPRNDDGAHLGSGIILAPSLGYMDRAFAEARLTAMSTAPIVEMLVPPTINTALAPKGAHVASMFCQHFPYNLPGGRDWRQERQRAVDLIFATVDSYAPNFLTSVVGYCALSPIDLEENLGLAGGDIFHAALGLDQLWAARLVLGYGDYRTPLKSLYLCGAGAHPGGGVTGIPGHNAAREMLRDGIRHVSRPNS